jgi:hypothetical protein
VKDPLGLPVCRITADYRNNERKLSAFIQDKMVEWYAQPAPSGDPARSGRRDGHSTRMRRHAHGRQR